MRATGQEFRRIAQVIEKADANDRIVGLPVHAPWRQGPTYHIYSRHLPQLASGLQLFFGPSFPDRWKKIHPDVPITDGMAQEHKFDIIEHTTLLKVVASIEASK